MKLGIIGCGNMGTAILQGALQNGTLLPNNVYVKNKDRESTQSVAKDLKVNACKSAAEVISSADTIILAVKPAQLPEVLDSIPNSGIDKDHSLFISIAAGIGLEAIASRLPNGCKIIRTMPNTPTLVGAGVVAYSANACCDENDIERLHQLLSPSASLTQVEENLMDVVTGLSGSGPAYVYMFIEALADGAVKEGLSRTHALDLAAKTVFGGAKMVLETEEHPARLRDQVASPGGTTIAGIAALEAQGLRNAAIQAVKAATERSRELS